MPRLFIDLDGVLADFEAGAKRIFGISAAEYEAQFGEAQMWGMLRGTPDYFYNLDPLPNALQFWNACNAVVQPKVLTGCPYGNWAEPQKINWCFQHLRVDMDRVICCKASNKSDYCEPGDVLVDDRDKYRDRWEAAGGVFIHFLGDYEATLNDLRAIPII